MPETDLARISAGELSHLAQMATAPNPLLMIPPDWVDPVSALWVCNAHLFKTSPLALCATLRSCHEQGLTTADVRRIVLTLLHPARRAGHRFEGDVIADLCGLAAEALRRQRSAAENEARRTEATSFAAGLFMPAE